MRATIPIITCVLLCSAACKGSDPAPRPDTPQSQIEIVTGGASAETPLPLIVAIHGFGDTPQAFQALFDGVPFQARVIMPQGLDPVLGGGWSWFPIREGDFENNSSGLATGMERATNGLVTWIEGQASQRPTVGKPIVTGFSQGGMLSYALAAKIPDRLERVLPISGMLPAQLYPSAPYRGPPLIALHGEDDPVVPIAYGDATVAAFVAAGAHAELRRYPGVTHQIPPAVRDDLLELLRVATASVAASH